MGKVLLIQITANIKIYAQILSKQTSFYIYNKLLSDINVRATVCALNLFLCDC